MGQQTDQRGEQLEVGVGFRLGCDDGDPRAGEMGGEAVMDHEEVKAIMVIGQDWIGTYGLQVPAERAQRVEQEEVAVVGAQAVERTVVHLVCAFIAAQVAVEEAAVEGAWWSRRKWRSRRRRLVCPRDQ